MGATLGLVLLVRNDFVGEAVCHRALNSGQNCGACVARIFQDALGERVENALREGFKGFVGAGGLRDHEDGTGAGSVAAWVWLGVDGDGAGSFCDVAGGDVGVLPDREGNSADVAGVVSAAGNLVDRPD